MVFFALVYECKIKKMFQEAQMVWSDALLISQCPLISPCSVCVLSWQAQASVLQPEGRNKQAPLGEWETARGGRGSGSIKMGRGEELWSRNPRSELVLVSPNCRNGV